MTKLVQGASAFGDGWDGIGRASRSAVSFGIHARGARLGAGAREERAVEENVAVRAPVPLLPASEHGASLALPGVK
jgi:hypothetical protein